MAALAFIVTLGTQDPNRLIAFYRDVVGLAPLFDFTPGAFALPGEQSPVLIVEPHSEVSGAAKEPARCLLNFVVDDMATEAGRIRAAGVTFAAEPYEESGVGMFATFADPDGNLCQLVQLFA
jgi:predicted enzyme related to lactoylglutathione lyase